VHYRWHPARGAEIEVHYRERRGGEEVYVCTVAQDAGVVIPAWMFDSSLCASMVLGTRRVAAPALRELRTLVDELVGARLVVSSGRVAPEASDEQGPTQNTCAAQCPSDDNLVHNGSAAGRTSASRGAGARKPPSPPGRASAKPRSGAGR